MPTRTQGPLTPTAAQVARRRAALLLALFTLAGFALRLPLVGRFPFREDEAIYAYWALHGWFEDPLFLHVWIDKPPLFLWLLQGAFALWGHSPPAAQVLNVLLSTLTVPVLAVTARRWWGAAAGLAAGLLAALNPFAISFAPTGFTDPLLVLAGSLAVACAARRRWLASGLWLGVAIMTKQQGLLFVPLVVGVMVVEWMVDARGRGVGRVCSPPSPATGNDAADTRPARRVAAFVGGVALVVVPVLVWDSLRWAVAPSPWELGARNAGFSALLPVDQWAARAAGWGDLLVYLLGSPAAWALYGVLLVAGVIGRVGNPPSPATRQDATSSAPACRAEPAGAVASLWLPALLAAWAAGFVALHVVTGVQVWDRYLLPLVVPVALLGGWAWAQVWRVARGVADSMSGGAAARRDAGGAVDSTAGYKPALRVVWWLAIGLAVAVAGGAAVEAAGGGLPVGGDHGTYAGLDAALAVADMPGALLLHRELGWHARYYLYDAVRQGDVALLYFPSTTYLADAAAKQPQRRRFVVQPDWAPLADLGVQLAARRLAAVERLRAGHFTVYELVEQPAGDAAWRVCRWPGPFRLAEVAGEQCR